MEISHNGRAADLAKILLGVQDTERTHNKKTASQGSQSQDRVQISEQAKETPASEGGRGTAGCGA
jgi:negative regulator of flagellin synthesis FlgM